MVMLNSKKYYFPEIRCFVLVILTLLVGCSSRYTVPQTPEQVYPGEVNRHVRWIQADSRQIFKILTSPEGMKSLCPEGTVVSFLPPLPYAAGTLVSTHINHIVKLKWTSQVEQVAENQRIRLTFKDGFFAGGTEIWELHPESNGTRVQHTIFVSPKGPLKQLAWAAKVRQKHDTMVELFLDNLKQTAEAPILRAGQSQDGDTAKRDANLQ